MVVQNPFSVTEMQANNRFIIVAAISTPDTTVICLFVQPRNKELEKEVLEWIFNCIGEPVPAGEFEDILKNGVVLCNLMNKLLPGSIKKIQAKGTNFQLMENIQRFQDGMKKYGVPQEEIFQTADLFERRNIPQVIQLKKKQEKFLVKYFICRWFCRCMLWVG